MVIRLALTCSVKFTINFLWEEMLCFEEKKSQRQRFLVVYTPQITVTVSQQNKNKIRTGKFFMYS